MRYAVVAIYEEGIQLIAEYRIADLSVGLVEDVLHLPGVEKQETLPGIVVQQGKVIMANNKMVCFFKEKVQSIFHLFPLQRTQIERLVLHLASKLVPYVETETLLRGDYLLGIVYDIHCLLPPVIANIVFTELQDALHIYATLAESECC